MGRGQILTAISWMMGLQPTIRVEPPAALRMAAMEAQATLMVRRDPVNWSQLWERRQRAVLNQSVSLCGEHLLLLSSVHVLRWFFYRISCIQ